MINELAWCSVSKEIVVIGVFLLFTAFLERDNQRISINSTNSQYRVYIKLSTGTWTTSLLTVGQPISPENVTVKNQLEYSHNANVGIIVQLLMKIRTNW